jgi:hypothetical protein
MQNYRLLKTLLISSFIGLNSCAKIPVYDREVCGDLGKYGAHCAHTLTDNKRDISKEKWDVERIGMLCMNSQAYNDVETALDQLCASFDICDYQTREELKASFSRMRNVVRATDKCKKGKCK